MRDRPQQSFSARGVLARGSWRLRGGRSSRSARLADFDALLRQRLEHGRDANQPLCFVSQIARSGGTLLTRLFDGHPALNVYPAELRLPQQIDLSAHPWEWFAQLSSEQMTRGFERGYAKGIWAKSQRHPLALVPSLQRDLLIAWSETRRPMTQREVFDLYFTSFFNAWLDYQGSTAAEKRWTLAFRPRRRSRLKHVDRFFSDYPDGRSISMIRDPTTWFASARKRGELMPAKRADVNEEHALDRWKQSALAMLEAREAYGGDRVLILTFEDLVERTEQTMRRLASWLAIDFQPSLLDPTFNGRAIVANSSFEQESTDGVIRGPLERASVLSSGERQRIAAAHHPTYEMVATVAHADAARLER